MERTCEEAKTEESARGGARTIGRLGTQRGQEVRQQTKRPQGWPGQKPQEDNRRPAQRTAAAPRALRRDRLPRRRPPACSHSLILSSSRNSGAAA